MKKTLLKWFLLTAFLIGAGIPAGRSLAWLTASDQAVNTFSVGNVRVRLDETANTDTDKNGTPDSWTGILVPGITLHKDPAVTVSAGNDDCWVFVRITDADWPAEGKADYQIASGWTELSSDAGVYYREVPAADTETVLPVLQDNRVTVSEMLTEENLAELTSAKLSLCAYGIQRAGFDRAEDAWAEWKDKL